MSREQTMDSNAIKCFICDVYCSTDEKYLGTNIARTLTMPMSTVLAKCLRTIVDTENEYFCPECVHKIEEYDQMVQLSLQIETELYELFRKKPIESCYLLDAEIVVERNTIDSGDSMDLNAVKAENNTSDIANENDMNDNYEEMVIEYLDEYESQSDDGELITDERKSPIEQETDQQDTEQRIQQDENDAISNESSKTDEAAEKQTVYKSVKKRGRGRPPKKKVTRQLENAENSLDGDKNSIFVKTLDELDEHNTTEHSDEDNRLTCDICGKIYKSKSSLCVHLGTHNSRKVHECDVCGKTFTQRGALVRHMPMHTGEKPHQCDVCGKQFIHYSSFHMHQMIHTNERKKTCSICGSGFRSNSHMTRHMRSHTGERPYACAICGKRFAQRYNMKSHFNTHQGIHRPQSRNHKCLICMEAFPRREKLNKHLRQDHHISDEDITLLAVNGPDSDIGMKIIARLKSSVYSKDDVLIEFIDDGGLILPDEIK